MARETPPSQIDSFQLALVLKSGREYCRRLERAALDFICLEEVSEKVDLSRDSYKNQVTQLPTSDVVSGGAPHGDRALRFDRSLKSGRGNTYLFDYQFTRQAGKVKENRVLLEKNGKKAKAKEAPPKMDVFQYADILLAPVQLLDERFQEFYSYRLLGEEILNGVKAWVLEVSPRISGGDRYLGGKIWLNEEDSGILRIDWDPTTFGHYESILHNAEVYKAEPRITSTTEFGFEKNGLRFPSVDLTEEAYLGGDGKKFVRSLTRVEYKNYKFFTVETETAVRK